MANTNPGRPGRGTALAALIGTAAAALATASVVRWEGTVNTPYRDVAGVWTVCTGDTAGVVPGRRESDAECAARLERQLVAHARDAVVRCTPKLLSRSGPTAAAVSFAYNVGPAAYCRSTAAKRFNAGDIAGGCDAMLAWNRAGGRVVRGLDNRRRAERALCLSPNR